VAGLARGCKTFDEHLGEPVELMESPGELAVIAEGVVEG
jgi:hypothetical protein